MRTSEKTDKVKFVFLGFCEAQPPNEFLYQNPYVPSAISLSPVTIIPRSAALCAWPLSSPPPPQSVRSRA
jgi:hypothetical protein